MPQRCAAAGTARIRLARSRAGATALALAAQHTDYLVFGGGLIDDVQCDASGDTRVSEIERAHNLAVRWPARILLLLGFLHVISVVEGM